MRFDASPRFRKSRLLRNGVILIHMLLDCGPTWMVRTAVYVHIRSWFSLTPRRFREAGGQTPTPHWQQIVSRHTDLCIDGCHGSGNTFVAFSLREALRETFEEDWAVVSHIHQVMQLKRALAFGVPALVLVRDPYGACNALKSKTPELLDWVILLESVCPAIQRMLKTPLVAYPQYRNPSSQHTCLRTQGRLTQALLNYASHLYERLQMAGAAEQAETRPVGYQRPVRRGH